VNSAAGKNLIGAFKQPSCVVIDPLLVASMDGREYRAGQVTLGIVRSADVGLEFAANPAGFALRVPDVDAAREQLAGAGVELTEVYDTGVCRLAFFSDPDGNRLVLHRRYAP